MTKDQFQEIIDNLPGEFPNSDSLIIANGTEEHYSLSIQLSKPQILADKGTIHCCIPLGELNRVKELYGDTIENGYIYFDSWYRGNDFYTLNNISPRSLKVISDCIDAILKDPNHHIYRFRVKKGKREYVEVG